MNNDDLNAKLHDFAKFWLAHDGLWFLAIEQKFGLETAIEIDRIAWSGFAPIEAKRIMKRLGLTPGGGIPALAKALSERMYALLNEQEITKIDDKHAIFTMKTCRVHEARQRKEFPLFPCKDVGLAEFTEFAKAIDPRIQTRCLGCPPDKYTGEFYCKWEFVIE
jgi:hypothetical protein